MKKNKATHITAFVTFLIGIFTGLFVGFFIWFQPINRKKIPNLNPKYAWGQNVRLVGFLRYCSGIIVGYDKENDKYQVTIYCHIGDRKLQNDTENVWVYPEEIVERID